MDTGDVDDPTEVLITHCRQTQPRRMKGRTQIQRDNLIPFIDWKVFNGCRELHSRVID